MVAQSGEYYQRIFGGLFVDRTLGRRRYLVYRKNEIRSGTLFRTGYEERIRKDELERKERKIGYEFFPGVCNGGCGTSRDG